MIINCDVLEGIKNLEDNSVNLIFTSPPYVDVKDYRSQNKTGDEYVQWILEVFKAAQPKLKPDGSFILNINDRVNNGFREIYVFELVVAIVKNTDFQLYERAFWNKVKGVPSTKRLSDRLEYLLWFSKQKPKIFIDNLRVPYSEGSLKRMQRPIVTRFVRDEHNQDSAAKKDWIAHPQGALPSTLINISSEARKVSTQHFAVFPERLVKYFVNGTTSEGDLVIDPFSGSGTTGVVCKKLHRRFKGFELNPDYCKEANERILKSSGTDVSLFKGF